MARSRRDAGPSVVVAAGAIVLSALCSVLLLWPQHGRALNWDEVDYLNAARMGVVTNLWERGSLSLPAYVRFAKAKIDHTDPPLPSGYDERTDPFKLRHGHSPGVVAAMAATADTHSERAQRAVQLVGAIALTIALVVAYRLISSTWTWAGLLVILLIGPWYGWHLFRTVQFHGWSAVWLCLTAAFLARWLTGGRQRSWGVALCASLALLILTLESSVFVIVAVAACLVIWVRGLGRKARAPWIRSYLVPGLLTVLAMTAVVWPGLILKAGFLKLPAERYYQVFLGEGEVYYFNRSADVLAYLLPAVVGIGTVAYLWRRRRADMLLWGPLVVVSAVYLVSVVRFAVSDAYFLPAFAPLLLLFAWIVGDLRPRVQTGLVAVLALVMVAGTASMLRSNDKDLRRDDVVRADFAFVHDFLGDAPGFLDGGHIWRHYLPDRTIRDVSFDADGLLVRTEGKYVDLPPSGYRGTVIGIQTTRSLFFDGPGARDLSARCPRVDRPTIVLWDCRNLSP